MSAFDPASVTAAVLAGGAGSRLGGRDKGLQLLGEKPLVAHVVDALSGQAASILICISRNDAAYATYGVLVRDAESGFRGPLAGISAALQASASAWLLTVPVDCPCPPSDLASRLHAALHGRPEGVAVVHDGTRREPLFALYRRARAPGAAAALEHDLPVWRWQDEIGAVEVGFADVADRFANLNTAEEFRAWENDRHG